MERKEWCISKVLEYILVIISIVVVATILAILVHPRHGEDVYLVTCLNNQRQLAMSLWMYAQDHDGVSAFAEQMDSSVCSSIRTASHKW